VCACGFWIGASNKVTFGSNDGDSQNYVFWHSRPPQAKVDPQGLNIIRRPRKADSGSIPQGIMRRNGRICRRNVLDSIGIVTYLNPVIGHHNGDLVGRECARSGRSVREVVLEMGLLEESVLDEILSPENLLRPHFRDLNVVDIPRVSRLIDSKIAWAITGSMTLSWSCPASAAKVSATSFPMTLKQTWFTTSEAA